MLQKRHYRVETRGPINDHPSPEALQILMRHGLDLNVAVSVSRLDTSLIDEKWLWHAFVAGFNASAVGYNGEVRPADPERQDGDIKQRYDEFRASLESEER